MELVHKFREVLDLMGGYPEACVFKLCIGSVLFFIDNQQPFLIDVFPGIV